MLRMILTGQVKSAELLEGALLAFLCFLPSLLAFRRGHPRFFIILGLNVALASVLPLAFVAYLAIGWVLLLGWGLRPGVADARLIRAQDTKVYDAVAALPPLLAGAMNATHRKSGETPIPEKDWSLANRCTSRGVPPSRATT